MLPANKHTDELKNIIEIIIAIIILANRNKNEEQKKPKRFTSFQLLEKMVRTSICFLETMALVQTKSKQNKNNHSVLIMCVDAGWILRIHRAYELRACVCLPIIRRKCTHTYSRTLPALNIPHVSYSHQIHNVFTL